jgi:hypothetical protein
MLLMMNPSFPVPPPIDCGGIGQAPKLGDPTPPCFLGLPHQPAPQHHNQPTSTSSAIKSGILASEIAPTSSPGSLTQTSRSSNGGAGPFQWSCAAAGIPPTDGTSALSTFGPTSGYYACYDAAAAAAADRTKTNAAAAAAAAFKMWPTAPGYPDFHHHHHAAAANAAMSCHQAADMYANAFAHHQSWPYTAYHHTNPHSAYERSLQTFQVRK